LSNFKFLKSTIREYYSKRKLEEPPYLHKREIALQSLEDGVYIRHLSFPSMTKLYEFILSKKTPLHLYYSSAYYENPANDRMELKGWLGSDLLFDIDSDKYSGCNDVISICITDNYVVEGDIGQCPSGDKPVKYPVVKAKCIEYAYSDAVKLYYILRDELGLRDIKIYFSGNRGFHVKVSDDTILDLSSDERREITSYVLLESISSERLFPPLGSKKKYALVAINGEIGIRARIAKLAKEAKLGYGTIAEYVKIPYEELRVLIEEARVRIDPVVTMDPSRLSRFSFSLNCKSGLLVKPVNIDDLYEFSFTDYTPWEGQIIVRGLIDASLPVLDSKVILKRSESISLEAHIAYYLILKNLVKVISTRDFGVRNV